MTEIRTVRASGPADLLALVPGLLGFHPEDSVVVVTVGDATHRFHARVDLPDDPVAVEEVAGYLVDVAAHNGVRALALVVYSDDAALARVVVDEVSRRLRRVGIDLVCVVRADGRRWWWVGGHRDGRGPGTPYDVASHPLMAEAVVEGTVVLGSRRELADTLVGTDSADASLVQQRVDGAAGRLREALGRKDTTGRAQLVHEGRWVRHRVRRFLGDMQRLDANDVARLSVLLAVSLELRDVAWAEMTHANAPGHVDLWRDVVRRAPLDLRAAPAALLGFAAWLSGNGALAWCAVDCAQEAEPGYGLAGLLAEALAGAVPPSAWSPVPPGSLSLFAG
jgi:hypothetical protein